jgi:L-serine/L-threonine ammonia-lyase
MRATANLTAQDTAVPATVARVQAPQSFTNTTTSRMSSSSSSSVANTRGCVAFEARQRQMFWTTPLVPSAALSALSGRPVYLKLDCLQASGSFKDRGMAHLILQLVQKKGILRIVSSSGGNAGLAAACMAQRLHLSCTVVVPTTTKAFVIDKLSTLYGATVQVVGENWNQADDYVRSLVAADATGQTAYIPPYDHEWLWTGHSTVVDEIEAQLTELQMASAATTQSPNVDALLPSNPATATIVVSVGGGGLLCGVLEGLERRQRQHHHQQQQPSTWTHCRVVAAETAGASCFGQSWAHRGVVTLTAIDSIATSLGALSVTPVGFERAQRYHGRFFGSDGSGSGGTVSSAVCTDAEAVDACVKVQILSLHHYPSGPLCSYLTSVLPFFSLLQLARDHRLLVEPACGAALAVLYSDRLRQDLQLQGGTDNNGPIVVLVCGGSGVNLDLLQQWQTDLC